MASQPDAPTTGALSCDGVAAMICIALDDEFGVLVDVLVLLLLLLLHGIGEYDTTGVDEIPGCSLDPFCVHEARCCHTSAKPVRCEAQVCPVICKIP
eukprot:901481-Amphidinium_carterae.1